MHKIIAIILIMFAGNTYSSDCFELAGRDYKIDPDLLRAISWHESRNRVNAIGINPVTGYGSGLMQIDSQHFKELSRYGIKPEHLVTDPCMNIYTGAYYLAIAFKKWGVTWRLSVLTMPVFATQRNRNDAEKFMLQKYKTFIAI